MLGREEGHWGSVSPAVLRARQGWDRWVPGRGHDVERYSLHLVCLSCAGTSCPGQEVWAARAWPGRCSGALVPSPRRWGAPETCGGRAGAGGAGNLSLLCPVSCLCLPLLVISVTGITLGDTGSSCGKLLNQRQPKR